MIEEHSLYYVFLDFYYRLTWELASKVLKNKVHTVNAYAVMTAACLAWLLPVDRQITMERTVDLPFLTFSLGRVADGAVGFFGHRESGTDMDMRVPNSERIVLTQPMD